MPYNLQGEWSIWDTDTQDIAIDPINDNWQAPTVPTPAFDGHTSPSSVFTTTTDTCTESHTNWIADRKELRIYVYPGVMGGLIGAFDLKEHLGRARSEHGQVDYVSLVFRQGDYAAHSNESANLRGWLSRNGFRKIDSYNGRGVLVEKDLTPKAEPPQQPKPKALPKPMTAQDEAQRYRDAGLNIPPVVQQLLALEKAKQDALENDPARRLAEVQKRIAELEKLKAEQDAESRELRSHTETRVCTDFGTG